MLAQAYILNFMKNVFVKGMDLIFSPKISMFRQIFGILLRSLKRTCLSTQYNGHVLWNSHSQVESGKMRFSYRSDLRLLHLLIIDQRTMSNFLHEVVGNFTLGILVIITWKYNDIIGDKFWWYVTVHAFWIIYMPTWITLTPMTTHS